MAKAIELLVHAGAPSNAKDDERYKAQAEAYLEFEGMVVDSVPDGGESQGVERRKEGHLTPHRSVASRLASQPGHHSTNIFEVETAAATKTLDINQFLDDTQLALTVLESQIISSNSRIGPPAQWPVPSIVTRRDSLPGHNKEQSSTADVEEPLVTTDIAASLHSISHERQDPSSTHSLSGGDTPSSYLKSPELDRPTKRARTGDHSVQLNHTICGSRPVVPIQEGSKLALGYVGGEAVDQGYNDAVEAEPLLQDNRHMSADNVTTSELPTTYSLSNITTESSKAKSHSMQRSVSDPGPVIISISDDTPVADKNIEPDRAGQAHELHAPRFPTKEALKVIDADIDIVVTSSRPKEAIQLMRTAVNDTKEALPTPVRPIDDPWLADLRTLPMSIQPPPPPTGLGMFTTHVTSTLRHLADSSPVATHFIPAETSREVRPLERGYWTFDANRMSFEQQVKFWQYLQRLIGSGNAGWGVWCTREHDETARTDVDSAPSIGLGTIKAYCWGEIAKHVYLLLYVASQSKVRRLGLQWIDSDGIVVVQMRRTRF